MPATTTPNEPKTFVMPKKTKRNDTTAKIDAELLRKARTIASYRDITLAEYLSEMLRPHIEREFDRFREQLAKPSKHPPRE